MKRRSLPESELLSSFFGYATAGFFFVNTPLWAIAFAVAFVLAEAIGSWARLMPFVWVEAWVGLVPIAWVGLVVLARAGAGLAGAVAGAGMAGAVAWFVLWAVSRHVAFTLPRGRLGSAITMAVFSGTGAVTWFVFGSVAGRVALAMNAGQFFIVVVVIAWAWAWAWAWFVFEALAGVVVGGVVWVAVGVGFACLVGSAVWTWAVAGAVAGFIVAAVSKARKELLKSFSKSHTFMIMAGTCLSGLSLGRLLSEVFF
ncbi:MAG TPA: hypothetical protein V6D26_21855 [Stenomitos sp.]